MLIIKGTREQIKNMLITGKYKKQTRICIKTKPSKIIFYLLFKYTSIEEIIISPSLYKTIGKKVKKVLKDMDIKFTFKKTEKGRKSSLDKQTLEKIRKMKRYKNMREISEKFRIPIRTIYYHLKRKKNGDKKH